MELSDINNIIPMYIDYFNNIKGDEWTEKIVYKRIHQFMTTEDSYSLIMEEGEKIIAFLVGYFEHFDDGFTYNLIEILVNSQYQDKGYGTILMNELEKRVKEEGCILIYLDAYKDEQHEHFYTKLGYEDATTFSPKVKLL